MADAAMMRRPASAAGFVLAASAPAAGPTAIRVSDLPPPLRKLHTCAAPDREIAMQQSKAGGSVMFALDCPRNAAGFASFAVQDEPRNDEPFSRLAFYLAGDARARGAWRLSFPYLHPDGRETRVDLLPAYPGIGWSTRANTSKLTAAAFLDPSRGPPKGSFHMLASFAPADRPHVTDVAALWQVGRGAVELIYWAETTERLRGENPHYQYPRYTVKLDRRPQR